MRNSEIGGGGTFFTINRLETLTDGVFAIVMTLLVLNLSIPVIAQTSAQSELPRRTLELWPRFLSYVISFIILGITWVSHHHMFHYIKRSNTTLMWINIGFLIFVALIPFSTAMAGDYPSVQFPFVVYGVNLIPVFILRYAIWAYATNKNHLVNNDIDPGLVKKLKFMPVIPSLILLVAIAISFLNIIAGYAALTLTLIYGALSQWIFRID